MSDISLDELRKNATPPTEEVVEEVEEVVEDPIPTIDPDLEWRILLKLH